MTQTPHTPAKPRAEDMESDDLTALYREGSTLEPGPLLDQRILAAAKAEVASDGQRRRHQRPSRPWWKVLLVPATTVAVGVLGISLAWRVVDQQERDARATMNAAEVPYQPPAASVSEAPASSAPVVANPAVTQGVKKEAKSDHATAAPGPRALTEAKPAAQSAAKSEMKSEQAAEEPSRRVAPAPAQVGELTLRKKAVEARTVDAEASAAATLSGQAASVPAAIPAAAAPAAAPAIPAPMPAARAARDDRAAEKASGAAMEAASASDDAATPEDWLKHIRELRAAGRDTEAARSLARFRLRFPDYAVPRDLGQ